MKKIVAVGIGIVIVIAVVVLASGYMSDDSNIIESLPGEDASELVETEGKRITITLNDGVGTSDTP